jgi:hypothetical protein
MEALRLGWRGTGVVCLTEGVEGIGGRGEHGEGRGPNCLKIMGRS